MADIKKPEPKKVEPTIKVEDLTLEERLQLIRVEINKMDLKKSGYNKNQDFYYFELSDFLPKAQELFLKYKMMPKFTIKENKLLAIQDKFQEVAYLHLVDTYNSKNESSIVFEIPTTEYKSYKKDYDTKQYLEILQNPIQTQGAKNTYFKRYLYINALELSEADRIDSGEEDIPKKEVIKPIDKKPINNTKVEPMKADVVKEEPIVYLTGTSQQKIINLLNEKDYDRIASIEAIAKSLGVTKSTIKESQVEEIINIINTKTYEEIIEGGKE